MKKRFIEIVILLIALLIIFLATDTVTDIFYPKSKHIHLEQTMVSTFWEQRGIHKRTCKHIQWLFVAVTDYESVEILQYYEERWNRQPKPSHPALAEAEYQGRFFAIFSFITSNFELSMDKYLGYVTQSIPLKEYSIGTHLYICRLEDW